MRYSLKDNEYGRFIYDSEGKALTLAAIAEILNHYEETNNKLKEEAKQYRESFEAELDGNQSLRKKYGAYEDETMCQFIERLATLSDQSELKTLRLKIKEDAKQIVDLMNKRDKEKHHRVYYQNIVYDVCARLDKTLGVKIVCGTADSPTTQVVEHLTKDIKNINNDWRNWAQKITGLVSQTYTDANLRSAIETLFNNHDKDLLAQNKILSNKLASILEICKSGSVISSIIEEELSLIDDQEIVRAQMLREIDELLRVRGKWIGGRYDSIQELIKQNTEMQDTLESVNDAMGKIINPIFKWVKNKKGVKNV